MSLCRSHQKDGHIIGNSTYNYNVIIICKYLHSKNGCLPISIDPTDQQNKGTP